MSTHELNQENPIRVKPRFWSRSIVSVDFFDAASVAEIRVVCLLFGSSKDARRCKMSRWVCIIFSTFSNRNSWLKPHSAIGRGKTALNVPWKRRWWEHSVLCCDRIQSKVFNITCWGSMSFAFPGKSLWLDQVSRVDLSALLCPCWILSAKH